MINKHLLQIEKENTFSCIEPKVAQFKKNNPDVKLISLGIGDVSKPIIKPVIKAMKKAVNDLANMKTFSGYGNYFGLDSLKETILKHEYQDYGFSLAEIYISNGTKSDAGNILELFDKDVKILLADPMYPIYLNSALALERNIYFNQLDENYKPLIPKEHYDIIYLTSPSNPIGNCLDKNDLNKWISYANQNKAIIIFDNVYAEFVVSNNIPKSIYEIEGSKNCCIEMRSFSKKASFTGLRCSYYLVPNDIEENINFYWKERTLNRFNGPDYIVQKGAEACYKKESKKLLKQNIKYYQSNAMYLKDELVKLNFEVQGGIDSPFLWVKIKEDVSSWEIFDIYLNKLGIIIIPGIIFGKNGDHHFRVSALGNKQDIVQAIERLKKYYE